jgi:hypothetical protein
MLRWKCKWLYVDRFAFLVPVVGQSAVKAIVLYSSCTSTRKSFVTAFTIYMIRNGACPHNTRFLNARTSNCRRRRRAGSPPPRRNKHARSPIHPDRMTGASQRRRQGRSPQKCFSGFTFFWKYKFRQKILLSKVDICRQTILKCTKGK